MKKTLKRLLVLTILLSMMLLPVFSFSYAEEMADAPTPVISEQPQDLDVELLAEALLTVVAHLEGAGELAYQWYVNDAPDYTGAAKIAGATAANYDAATDELGTWYYYVVVTGLPPEADAELELEADSEVELEAESAVEPVSVTSEIVTVTVYEVEPLEETEIMNELLTSTSSDELPLRFHYKGYWQDIADNMVEVDVGGRIAIQAIFYSGEVVEEVVVVNEEYYVMYLLDKGYVTGKTATSFAPNEAITRAEFITILARMSQETLPAAYQGPFTDVASDTYYEQAVAWAVAAGIVNGTTDTSFSPNQPIMRQEIAAMIVRYAEHKSITLPQTNQPAQFNDIGQISVYAREAVGRMQQAAIISGYEDGSFRPLTQANRAEVAKMLALVDALN